jgi:hypothetical protein
MTEKIHHDLSKEPIRINECCKYDLLMATDEVLKRFDPKNTNTHTPDSVDRMMKVLKFQGFDKPVIISKNTGILNQGHKRSLAAKKLKQAWIPVVWRTFDSIDQEKAASISDNATGQESKIDMAIVNELVSDFDPITLEDPDILGLKDFTPVPEDKFDTLKDRKETLCPHCGLNTKEKLV